MKSNEKQCVSPSTWRIQGSPESLGRLNSNVSPISSLETPNNTAMDIFQQLNEVCRYEDLLLSMKNGGANPTIQQGAMKISHSLFQSHLLEEKDQEHDINPVNVNNNYNNDNVDDDNDDNNDDEKKKDKKIKKIRNDLNGKFQYYEKNQDQWGSRTENKDNKMDCGMVCCNSIWKRKIMAGGLTAVKHIFQLHYLDPKMPSQLATMSSSSGMKKGAHRGSHTGSSSHTSPWRKQLPMNSIMTVLEVSNL